MGSQIISEFTGDYSWLSNFYPCTIVNDGMVFWSVEHAYQAAKTHDIGSKLMIKIAATPGRAKRLGKGVELRPDWETYKLEIMLELLRMKFVKPPFRQQLIETHPTPLVEGNWWHDTYWGVYNGVGQNHLGRLLMQVREELINAS